MFDRSSQSGNQSKTEPDKSYYSPPPAVSLPKGGGAIKGIGEKFAANPVTGTGSMTVPIATSPGRSGFGPQLSLSYDSGAGNGPFGFGWSLSLPSITRKTDKGLPRYLDGAAADVFILSGAEDLVPVLEPKEPNSRTVGNQTYTIQHYRPRIEGLFARIERWTNQAEPQETFWRSISKDNITTWYGKGEKSRIADPDDPTRIFSWLICESYDDKGNVIAYHYKEEDLTLIDLSQAHERHRSRLANRYLKYIRYGNREPYSPQMVKDKPWSTLPGNDQWLFEVVFDYGEHDANNPKPDDGNKWQRRIDPFSSYRAGFEVRTYRLCQRVLMFHHIPDLSDGTSGYDGLVRSTDFTYRQSEIASFITSITQSGYKRNGNGYLKKSLPALEFAYSQVKISEEIQEIGGDSLDNLPIGLDGKTYQWVDLDSEGLSGILTEQAEGWFYKRNLGNLPLEAKLNGSIPPEPPIAHGESRGVRFAALEWVATKPSMANLQAGRQQLLDLAGDGQLDLAEFGGATPGFYERTADGQWDRFKPFESLPNVAWNDPNLRFVDLNGDGHADVLITEHEAFTWYPSLAEAGFGAAERVSQSWDEEQGSRLVFADGTQSVYLADMSGDGLVDLVRIRNGEVCYWPSLGYGRFGAKVTMDHAPWFDYPELFDQKRIRVGDIDGSGTTDIFYLRHDQIRIWLNQSGNSLKEIKPLTHFPRIDDLSAVTVVDLLGNGTACLVWSSPLPGDARQPMRYIDLMGGEKQAQDSNQPIKGKPHLLVKIKNNMGAETRVRYASSTQFYLQDRAEGNPWITKLPFPVHVVERVETYDQLTGNRFVTMYRYHHGYFDGVEREFRGFGYVEQWDTETYPEFQKQGSSNALEEGLHVPPVYTRTWFHTGVYVDREHISNFFAEKEYYREPQYRVPPDASETDRQQIEAQFQATLLPDTILPRGLTAEEEREACRSLKGRILRQEVYAVDGTEKSPFPYSVSERSYEIRLLQGQGQNRHGVFFTYDRETINYYYERSFILDPTDPETNPQKKRKIFDPRISHAMTLEVDKFGNVLKSVAIGYPRRQPQHPEQGLIVGEATKGKPLITYTENQVTNEPDQTDWYRIGVPIETRTYEITGLEVTGLPLFVPYTLDFIGTKLKKIENRLKVPNPAPKPEIAYEELPDPDGGLQRRLIERVRSLYRKQEDAGKTDLTPLPQGKIDSLALPYESYKMAFTSGLLSRVFDGANGKIDAGELTSLLGKQREADKESTDGGGYVKLAQDGIWWIPSGRQAFDANHFYLPIRIKDPFDQTYTIEYDKHHLLVQQTIDPLNNTVVIQNDYRVMQPWQITDPNGNRSRAAFDALGMVVGTAVMGKAPDPTEGDSLTRFEADLTQDEIQAFFAVSDPRSRSIDHLGTATTRFIYDLDRFRKTGQPVCVAAIASKIHESDRSGQRLQEDQVQVSFVYSDGFGRELQTKIQAEPGEAPLRDGDGQLIRENGKLKLGHTDPRWVGTGRKVYNNKGKPIKQYEPFFSSTPQYETEADLVEWGVTPILHYDPLERVIRTEMPNGTFEKVEFDAWHQESWDANDTVLESCWYAERKGLVAGDPEGRAAKLTLAAQNRNLAGTEVGTPSIAHLDVLGRTFVTIADNGIDAQGNPQRYDTHVELDIEGNQLIITDARKNPVMIYAIPERDTQGKLIKNAQGNPELKGRAFDLLGHNLYSYSGDAGERWVLNNVAGKPIRHWDSRGYEMRYEYDALQRPTHLWVKAADATDFDLAEQTVYGESYADPDQAKSLNLRGKVYQLYDGAGIVTNQDYDFKGNLLHGSRQLVQNYRETVNWAVPTPLEEEIFTSSTVYDALNRPIQLLTPHTDTIPASEVRPIYNEANLLEQMRVRLRGAATETVFVQNIDYNAKGQRTLIEYDNGVTTAYTYDPETFRLTNLKTTRQSDPAVLQNLSYTYDPIGNITAIRDNAQQTIFFKGQVVSPHTQYEYDALYRLTQAEGREHRGQTANNRPEHRPELKPHYDFNDSTRMGLEHPHDGQAMRNYTEHYRYDAVGNILAMNHQAEGGDWTRYYDYESDNNRLRTTSLPSDAVDPQHLELLSTRYTYNAHGSMTKMPHLPEMQWDFKDQLQQVRLTRVNSETNPNEAGVDRAYYVYDASGQRVRKVIEHKNGNGDVTGSKERIYLGGFELYRERNTSGIILERETLHMMDDQQRIALVETKTLDVETPNASTTPVIRYQLSNHLGSASVEVDETGAVISYEEYHPYGTTSYQAGRSVAEVSLKRYRYTGKERDEETGLSYHGARYYATWLGRWISCDPLGIVDNLCLYCYVQNSPAINRDPNGRDTRTITVEASGWYTNKSGQRVTYKRPAEVVSEEHTLTKTVTVEASGWYTNKSGQRVTYKKPAEVVSEEHTFSTDDVTCKPPEILNSSEPIEEQDLLDQEANNWKESEPTQFIVGLTTGFIAGATPGGFVAGIAGEASGVSKEIPRTIRMGYGVGEMLWGVLQVIGGAGGEVVGGTMVGAGAAATGTGVGAPAGVPGMAGGAGLITISTSVLAEGIADFGVGYGVFASALKSSGGSGTSRQAPAPDNYRGRYNAERHAEGKSRLPSDWDAHHRIPQEYQPHPEFRDFDFHAPSNIQGVKGSRADVNIHQEITNLWAEFRRANPSATRQEIEAFARKIDVMFNQHWWQ